MASPNELFFLDRYLEVPLVPGVLSSLARLRSRFAARIYLISTNIRRRPQALEILEKHGILGLVGRDHVVMCDTDAAKANACRQLGISHFVDDRIEVLELLDATTRRYLFTSLGDAAAGPSLPSNMLRVSSWSAIERDLLPPA
jgi:FMN phosphatase YigB (HAD superfamily)